MEEEHGTFVVEFGTKSATPLNKATVRLTVTVVRDGDDAVSREFVAETAGTTRSTRAAQKVCDSVRQDAQDWIESLKPPKKKRAIPTRVVPVPVNAWQRFLLALANLPVPLRTEAAAEPREEIGSEIGDGTVMHTAAASISVDSLYATDTVSTAGNTNGSPYQLAQDLAWTVTFDLRSRLNSLQYDLEK
jgi:hypothetical protein